MPTAVGADQDRRAAVSVQLGDRIREHLKTAAAVDRACQDGQTGEGAAGVIQRFRRRTAGADQKRVCLIFARLRQRDIGFRKPAAEALREGLYDLAGVSGGAEVVCVHFVRIAIIQ